MFSLIITIIAIVLVTALALATVYYGGSAFKDGKSQAKAAEVVLQGQQISAAVDLYRTANQGALPPSMDALVADQKYLSSKPNVEWTFATDYVVYPMTDMEACKKANKALNLDLTTIPMCSAVTDKTICCQKD
jgi:type II secretory pathway pseudopilin PulG